MPPSPGSLKFGAVLFWTGFRFEDGGQADKLFVALGAKQGKPVAAVVCTSKQHRRQLNPGCNAKDGYFLIPGGGRDWFKVETWVLLYRVFEFPPAEMVKAMLGGDLRIEANLRTELAAAIRNCLTECPSLR